MFDVGRVGLDSNRHDFLIKFVGHRYLCFFATSLPVVLIFSAVVYSRHKDTLSSLLR